MEYKKETWLNHTMVLKYNGTCVTLIHIQLAKASLMQPVVSEDRK